MSFYQALAKLEANNQPGAVCTIIQSRGSTPRRASSKMLVYRDGSIMGTIGGGEMESRVIAVALESIREGKPRLLKYSMTDPERGDPGVCGGQLEIYVEPLLPKPVLIIIGAGHVGKAVAHLAKWLGFWVVVSDDRPEFCNAEAIPDGDEFYPIAMEDLPKQFEITPWSYLVLTTRGVDIDVPGLPGLLRSPAAYLGVIGSKRRWETTRNQLLALGVSESEVNKVRSPIGLELNAETPEEIAVSIMAEIIMLRGRGDGKAISG